MVVGVGQGDFTPPSTVADVELPQEVREVITTRAPYGYRRNGGRPPSSIADDDPRAGRPSTTSACIA